MGSIAIFSCILSIAIFSLLLYWGGFFFNYFFSKTGNALFTRDSYECGFKSNSDINLNIDIQFFILGLIFLIFEMEIIIFLPICFNILGLNFFLLFVFFLGIFFLVYSFWYDWNRYALNFIF